MIVGIDLGGMSAKAAVLKDGRLIGKSSVKTSSSDSPEETARSLVKLSLRAAEAAGVAFDEIEAIGVGSPGVVDSGEGIVAHWSNFGWENVPLAEEMQRSSGKKVFVTNDANAAALGEAKFGAGKTYSDSILVTLGTGVGGGIVLGGKLFEGFKSAGAEIGHMVIRRGGRLCTCGRRGCFERYASAGALVCMTRAAMRREEGSLMNEIPLRKADGRTAFDAARRGDPAARLVLSEYVAALGEGIANLVNIFRPQAVILGGGISAEGEFLLAPLREYVLPRLYASPAYAPIEILAATLGNDAGLYGAAEYALSRL